MYRCKVQCACNLRRQARRPLHHSCLKLTRCCCSLMMMMMMMMKMMMMTMMMMLMLMLMLLMMMMMMMMMMMLMMVVSNKCRHAIHQSLSSKYLQLLP